MRALIFLLVLTGCAAYTEANAPYGYNNYCNQHPQDVICGGTDTK